MDALSMVTMATAPIHVLHCYYSDYATSHGVFAVCQVKELSTRVSAVVSLVYLCHQVRASKSVCVSILLRTIIVIQQIYQSIFKFSLLIICLNK